MEQVTKIAEFILESFIHIWPYLVITIPLAVFVRLSDVSKQLKSVLSRNPVISVFLATAVGAFSPFCSCGVIPVIASMLIGGVPLAPVMSFWIASPSMDPEIFFLSAAAIGWEMSAWRLAATFIISLLGGYITHLLIVNGWLGEEFLKKGLSASGNRVLIPDLKTIARWFRFPSAIKTRQGTTEAEANTNDNAGNYTLACCCHDAGESTVSAELNHEKVPGTTCGSKTCDSSSVPIKRRIADETLKAVMMVAKFMTLAFLINALIQFYVPQEFVYGLLGREGSGSVLIASLVGVPVYTSNLTALPLVSGLLEKGMSEGAALAFLIAGPMTTLPAMSAVIGLVRRKVFVLYISFALAGSVLFGLLMNILA